MSLLLRRVEAESGALVDVRIEVGVVTAIAPRLTPRRAEEQLDAGGGALLPGLHDHHLHLRALAAAAGSVAVGPAAVSDEAAFSQRLRSAAADVGPGEWLRAVGYHESVAGYLDRWKLDGLVPDRPVRVQHRSGALWILNSLAVAAADLEGSAEDGVERDAAGRATGRIWRMDTWLRDVVPTVPIDFTRLGAWAAKAGITGFTDADPVRSADDVAHLAAQMASGALPQRILVMGPPGLRVGGPGRLLLGAVKLLLDDNELPAFDDLTARIGTAHADGRPLAVHCVTRPQLLLTLAAFAAVGTVAGDRIEHASVVPTEAIPELRRLGLTVVTQPNFVGERGDDYLRDVDVADRPHLYRLRSLLDAGIPVAGGTDAPFGDRNPWAAMAAAVARRTPDGRILSPAERIRPEEALSLFLGEATDPGSPRRVTVGGTADLCLLTVPRAEALGDLAAATVAATIIGGQIVYREA